MEYCKRALTRNWFVFGSKTILAGSPNTGKSTLLNCFAGRQKSIVTDISGITRDWVIAQYQIKSLLLELFDTAELDENLSATSDSLDNAAPRKTL